MAAPQHADRHPAVWHGLRLPAGLSYALAGLFTTAAFAGWNSWISQAAYLEEFRANARERIEQIKALYLVELTRQQGIGALFANARQVSAREFKRFVRQTEVAAPIARLSLALIKPVPRGEQRAFERALRQDYGPATALISGAVHTAAKAPTGERALYFPIRYAEPVRTELSVPGLDLGNEPAAAEALRKAAATGGATFAAVRPNAAGAGASAFRLFTPIYRDGEPAPRVAARQTSLIGFICGTFRYSDLLEAVFSRSSHLGQHVYAFESAAPGARPVYTHRSRLEGAVPIDPDITLTDLSRYPHRVEETFALADRQITLAFVPVRPATVLAHFDHRSRMVALGGLLISVLLAFLGRRVSRARAEREASEERLRLAATVFHDAHEGIAITDAAGNIIDVNGTFSRITGYPRDEVLGKNPRMLKSGVHDAAFYREFWQTLITEGVWRGEIWNRHRNGDLVAVQATVSAVRDDAGRISHFIDLFSDITDRKAQQEHIEHLAYFDALTDLPNRALLLDRLEQGLARARRDGSIMCVAYLDLDDFKPVNDTHGHKAGDLLLCEIARRLKASVREHDTVCRLGGDEFVIILAGLHSWEECERILSRTLEGIARPCTLSNGTAVTVSGSIGVTLNPPDRSTADILLRHADQAMYIAKRAGRNRIHRFATPATDAPLAASASG